MQTGETSLIHEVLDLTLTETDSIAAAVSGHLGPAPTRPSVAFAPDDDFTTEADFPSRSATPPRSRPVRIPNHTEIRDIDNASLPANV